MTEKKKYRKKPIVITAYKTDKELEIETLEGTMKANKGDYVITGVKGEEYPCKPDVFEMTYVPADESLEDDVSTNLMEWSSLITELSAKEREFYERKQIYEFKSEKILEDAAKEKADNDNDVIKKMYGGNNDKTRKKYVKEMLKADDRKIKELEFSIDYLKRRISFIKQLVYTKTVLMEVKE